MNDTKRMIVGMVLALALVLGWHFVVYQIGRYKNWDMNPQPAPPPVAAQNPALASAPAAAPAPAGGASAPAPIAPVVVEEARPVTVTLGSAATDDSRFALALELDSRGAAITRATLNHYLRAVHADEKKVDPKAADSRFVFQLPQGNHASLATRALIINGQRQLLESAHWRLEASDVRQATFALDLMVDGKPSLRLRKHVELFERSVGGGAGYEVLVRYTLENLGSDPVKAQLEFNGPTAPPREMDRSSDVVAVAGHDSGKAGFHQIELQSLAASSLTAGQTKDLKKSDKDYPFAWAGLSSAYFEALVLPASADGSTADNFISAAEVSLLNADAPVIDRTPALSFTSEWDIPAKAAVSKDLRVYLGPKLRDLLENPYYGAFPRMYDATLAVSGGCSYCTFQWLVNSMVWLLNIFHSVLRDWGLSIIALVILVRLVLHPITKKSTISMHKMSKLAPEMERLKKKYGDNKEELNRAMMQFYKEHGATPVLGCLPMFLQMPIWIALWSSLQSTFELRQAPFLQLGGTSLTWIHDLAKPDRLFYFPQSPINLFLFSVDSINLLPILMGVVFFLQQKYQPQQAAMTPEQEQQKKMMQWMTLLFPLMLYTGPSGLNLYILTSTTIGIIESKRIRDHIKERELAAGPGGRVVIDVEPTNVSQSRDKGTKPAGGLKGIMARAQEWAEEMRKEQNKKKPK